jgi:lipoprotein-anchoring transpeptidase ErfK/SrfK
MRVNGDRVSNSCWRIAVLTTAAALGSASQAAAAIYYYPDSEPGFSRPAPAIAQQRRQKARRQTTKKIEAPVKEAAKPLGPLILSVSIQRQKLSIYDANGFYAETPISTGMPGHPTPMGVFSVLEKEKMHHSNIYSGAPMPFMQRITWSGVAMHAGVLPGYPASHGCIRMPMAFAVKMYGWTRPGARVFVTPGDVTPASFSHPLLAAQKVVPQPVAADEPKTDAPTSAKADKAAADATIKPETTEAALELRPSVGHSETAQPVSRQSSDATPLRDQTHTADASNALPPGNGVTMSDATTGAANPPPREAPAAANPAPAAPAKENDAASADKKSEAAAPATANSEAVKSETAKSEATEPAVVKSAPEPAAAQAAETASTQDKPVETKSPDTATAEARPADAAVKAEIKAETKADEAKTPMQPSSEAVKAEASTTASTNPAETKAEAKPDAAKPDPVKAETAQAVAPAASQPSDEKPTENSKPVTVVPSAPASVPDANKDQARLPDADKPVAPKPVVATLPAAKPNAQIAVFISRKDSKLYVRQNFTPLFSVPVTIAPGDRPLGTHVFTAQLDKSDNNLVHWSVVSLPVSLRGERREVRETDDRHSRKRKVVVAVETKPLPVTDSPAEALDRITIPPEAMARITEALSTGSSITVSDQGIAAGETGEGTDFIVSLR